MLTLPESTLRSVPLNLVRKLVSYENLPHAAYGTAQSVAFSYHTFLQFPIMSEDLTAPEVTSNLTVHLTDQYYR